MPYEIYVIANSDLFREGLNAVATFCQTDGFKSAAWIGSALGIVLTIYAYISQHDVFIFLKWFATYFIVFNILLGVTSTVAVINISDQTVPPQVIDNVPIGLALPASIITSVEYEFSSDLETVFSFPDEMQYHKTGMLFGSNLFQLSLASTLDDPTIMNEMNNYVRSCVVGDILINHKYTFNDLLHSDDIWGLMTSNPSPIRGIFINGVFNTCVQAATLLTTQINQYSESTAPAILALFIPTRNAYTGSAVNTMLDSTYHFFNETSSTGTNILKQNIAINAFRSGIKNYAFESGSVAGMENMANAMAMANTRMAWASSRHIGVETLPLMQVVLLLLAVCLFPLFAILMLLPGMGINSFKNYIYFLLWLESWPIMYTILNMAMNFYLSSGTPQTVTLSSINLLAQEHSDITGIAGYLVLAIPFLSLGLVKGMAYTFNNAAQYLGGMMHSIAQGSAASVTTGNYSLGNVSMSNATANNVSANKHDTNFSNMQDLSTQQLGNATTVTSTPMGSDVFHTGAGMSQLAVGVNAVKNIVSSLSQQADNSIRSALNHNTQFVHSMGHNQSLGSSFSEDESAKIDHAMSTLNSMTDSYSKKEGISRSDAFKRLSEISGSLSESANASVGFKIFSDGEAQSVSLNATQKIQASSQHDDNYSVGSDNSITANDARNFTSALDTVKSFSAHHSYSDQNSASENLAIQMGSDLTKAESLSSSAQFIQSHSDAINMNFSQAFSNYVQTHYPNEANSILSATEGSLLVKQQALADQFIQTHAKQLAQEYGSNSRSMSNNSSSAGSKYMTENYRNTSERIAGNKNLSPSSMSEESLSSAVRNKIQQSDGVVGSSTEKQLHENSILANTNSDDIKQGKSDGTRGIIHHGWDTL